MVLVRWDASATKNKTGRQGVFCAGDHKKIRRKNRFCLFVVQFFQNGTGEPPFPGERGQGDWGISNVKKKSVAQWAFLRRELSVKKGARERRPFFGMDNLRVAKCPIVRGLEIAHLGISERSNFQTPCTLFFLSLKGSLKPLVSLQNKMLARLAPTLLFF